MVLAMPDGTRICALDGCPVEFVPPAKAPHKRFCSKRHRSIAEKRRYRLNHREPASCKRCGKPFERDATTKRKQVFCSLRCQAVGRSVEYVARPDIQEQLKRARALRAR